MINSEKTVPVHIGIIMDGNGRWATKRHESRSFGHEHGTDAVNDIINGCLKLGVKYLTLYTFSTENVKRPKDEVNDLMHLVITTINKNMQNLQDKKVRVKVIGDLNKLDSMVVDCFNWCIEETSHNNTMDLIIAMNYSSRDEITRAVRKISQEVKEGVMDCNNISEETISQHLDTKDIPDPDLIIRTGGEYRLSNFLMWQASYSELVFTDILWPDFTENDLYKAVDNYMHRDRRFGMVSENE